jgi:hypothetical protein
MQCIDRGSPASLAWGICAEIWACARCRFTKRHVLVCVTACVPRYAVICATCTTTAPTKIGHPRVQAHGPGVGVLQHFTQGQLVYGGFLGGKTNRHRVFILRSCRGLSMRPMDLVPTPCYHYAHALPLARSGRSSSCRHAMFAALSMFTAVGWLESAIGHMESS